jgi:hypothetical protein
MKPLEDHDGNSRDEERSAKSGSLGSVMDSLEKAAEQSDILTLDAILASVRRRGFGPLLIVPALLSGLPTGAIPGIPAICGLIIIFISLQLVIGRERPWLPKKMLEFQLSAESLRRSLKKVRPLADLLDKRLYRRFSVLTDTKFAHAFAAATIICLSLAMIFFGFVPLFPMLFSIPIVMLALGMIVSDGLIFATAYLLVVIIAWMSYYLLG